MHFPDINCVAPTKRIVSSGKCDISPIGAVGKSSHCTAEATTVVRCWGAMLYGQRPFLSESARDSSVSFPNSEACDVAGLSRRQRNRSLGATANVSTWAIGGANGNRDLPGTDRCDATCRGLPVCTTGP